MPFASLDWTTLAPGIALWALALYLPLTVLLGRLEQPLAEGPLPELLQQLLLGALSVLLAALLGGLTDLGLGLALGPGWASSLGLIAVLWGLFTAFASRAREDGE